MKAPRGKVDPSGVIFTGLCDLETRVCTARTAGPITQVWAPPGQTPVNVCQACLEEKARLGEWIVGDVSLETPRARWRTTKSRAVTVEPSGVVMTGVCSIQGKTCRARTPYPITAVWAPPGRTQVDVCRPCLEEKILNGDWYVEGARVEPRPGKSA